MQRFGCTADPVYLHCTRASRIRKLLCVGGFCGFCCCLGIWSIFCFVSVFMSGNPGNLAVSVADVAFCQAASQLSGDDLTSENEAPTEAAAFLELKLMEQKESCKQNVE